MNKLYKTPTVLDFLDGRHDNPPEIIDRDKIMKAMGILYAEAGIQSPALRAQYLHIGQQLADLLGLDV